jgi:bifunctional DNA-binding transcriptional regulator/antitoxin component of YhaV-PrlF toxin-antitoxin module
MSTLAMGNDGSIHLPDAIRDRYGLTPDRPLRIIETKGGILIVPLTDEPMDAELVRELEEWQALGQKSWEPFPYETIEA